MATSKCYQRGNGVQGEVQIWEKKGKMQREDRGRWSTSTETFAVYPAPAKFLELNSPGGRLGSSVWFSGWRGEGLGKNGVQRKVLAGLVGFIPRQWTRCSWFQTSGIG
jgi:hypothetical protein